MNRLHLNLALLGTAVGLGALLYFTREVPEQGPPLTTLSETTLQQVRIEHPGRPAIVLQRKDGTWQLTAPVTARADPMEVSSITQLVGMPARRSLAVADVQLSELKLDPPLYRVYLDDTVLEIGDREPLEHRRYIRVGDRVALTDEPPSAALDADYADLVAKELLPPDAHIVRIEVPGLTLARTADGQGWTSMPEQPQAGADDMQRFVDAWASARAMWNAAALPDAPDAGEPIVIVTRDGRLDLRLLAREPQLVIENRALGIRYVLSRALEGELLRLPTPAAGTADDISS